MPHFYLHPGQVAVQEERLRLIVDAIASHTQGERLQIAEKLRSIIAINTSLPSFPLDSAYREARCVRDVIDEYRPIDLLTNRSVAVDANREARLTNRGRLSSQAVETAASNTGQSTDVRPSVAHLLQSNGIRSFKVTYDNLVNRNLARELDSRMIARTDTPNHNEQSRLAYLTARLEAHSNTHRTAVTTYEVEETCDMRMNLAETINIIRAEPDNFQRGCSPETIAQWVYATATRDAGPSDLVLRTLLKRVLAVLEKKRLRVLPCSMINDIRAAADSFRGLDDEGILLEVSASPPGSLTMVVSADTAIDLDITVSKVICQLFLQHHKYQTRWSILDNSRSSIIGYLASSAHIIVSRVMNRTNGQNYRFTIASAMLAVGLITDAQMTNIRGVQESITYLKVVDTSIPAENQSAHLSVSQGALVDVVATPIVSQAGGDQDMAVVPTGQPNLSPSDSMSNDIVMSANGYPPKYFGADFKPASVTAKVNFRQVLRIGQCIGQGRLWDVFEALLFRSPLDMNTVRPEQLGHITLVQDESWSLPTRQAVNLTEQSITVREGQTPPANASLGALETGPSQNGSPESLSTSSGSDTFWENDDYETPDSALSASDTASTSEGIPVVVKMATQSHASRIKLSEHSWLSETSEGDYDVAEGVALESGVMENDLAHLQGRTIAKYYGLWQGHIQSAGNDEIVWLMVLERLGRPVVPHDLRWIDIHDMDIDLILALYKELGKAKVVHGDMEKRHILRTLDGEGLRLIDFDRCQRQASTRDLEMQRKEIRRRLGLNTELPWNMSY